MAKQLNYQVKQYLIELSGACFWYWKGFYGFLSSCGVPKHLQERYPKDSYNKYDVMRNLLDHFDSINNTEIPKNIASEFYRMNNAVDREELDQRKAKKLLSELKSLLGNDPIEEEIKKRQISENRSKHKLDVEKVQQKVKKLTQLNSTFLNLHTNIDITPQVRGYKLEELFCDLLHHNEFEYRPSYKTTDGEQIDGHFKYDKFDYLLECKWVEGLIKQPDLSIFDGKIRGKAQSTRGLFLGINGFDAKAVTKFSVDSPRIILMTGQDLAVILSGMISLSDAMKKKVDAITCYGKIDCDLG